jgi:hypothetical protein
MIVDANCMLSYVNCMVSDVNCMVGDVIAMIAVKVGMVVAMGYCNMQYSTAEAVIDGEA